MWVLSTYWPRCQKTCLWGFWPSGTQTCLLRYIDWLECSNFSCSKFSYHTFKRAITKVLIRLRISAFIVCMQVGFSPIAETFLSWSTLLGVKILKFSTCPWINRLQKSTWLSLKLTCENFTTNSLLLIDF